MAHHYNHHVDPHPTDNPILKTLSVAQLKELALSKGFNPVIALKDSYLAGDQTAIDALIEIAQKDHTYASFICDIIGPFAESDEKLFQWLTEMAQKENNNAIDQLFALTCEADHEQALQVLINLAHAGNIEAIKSLRRIIDLYSAADALSEIKKERLSTALLALKKCAQKDEDAIYELQYLAQHGSTEARTALEDYAAQGHKEAIEALKPQPTYTGSDDDIPF